MPTFKDYLASDLDTFISLDEFAELHDIDGRDVPAVIDEDAYEKKVMGRTTVDGVYLGGIVLYVKETDLGYRPAYGQIMRINKRIYLVDACNSDNGLLTVTLGANES